MHASYLENVFHASWRALALKQSKAALKGRKFNGILVSAGVSGMLGVLLAHQLKKKLVVARKTNDGSHSSYKVENIYTGDRLIFIDDLISSGHTLRHCIDSARKVRQFTLVGAYTYATDRYYEPEDLAQRFPGYAKDYFR